MTAAFTDAVALADAPTRTFLGGSDFTLPADICGFPVGFTTTKGKTVETDFSNGTSRFTGQFQATATNLVTGKAVDLNASGPLRVTFDGGVLTFDSYGNSLIVFFPGDSDLIPAGIYIFTGKMTVGVDPATGQIISIAPSHRSTGLCDLLR